jgi:hypothetical protein
VLRVIRYLIAVVLFGFAAGGTSHAINIVPEYPAGVLFTNSIDLIAKPAINAAAADLSAAITTTLNAINTDAYTGVNGQTNVTFGWQFLYTDPVLNSSVTIPIATISANTVAMHVGARNLTGSTLGVGGPGQVIGDNSQFAGGGFPGQWVGAVANAESAAEAAYKRGGGPIVQSATGSATLGDVTANYSVDYTIAHGSLSLDWDSNDNGMKDTEAQLNAYWHFNHTTPVAAGKNDLYSVALHEMLHAIGIGTSNSWTSRVSGGVNWTGPEVATLYGSGTGLVSSGHITEGIMSTRISDGTPQEVVMDPTITQGTRKSLTSLDLAFLRDIGYSTIIPNPSFSPADFDQDGFVDDDDLLTWRNAYGVNANGDTDDDNDTDGRDFLVLQREFTGSGPLSAGTAIPEPGLATLTITALLCLTCSRRR